MLGILRLERPSPAPVETRAGLPKRATARAGLRRFTSFSTPDLKKAKAAAIGAQCVSG